ncbi:two-component system nitrate/nitrite sensor histidine kinase NarX [Silvimonas terrae]|uniref:Sensor protein n=1 Tax=Silvimonas terrae TaxID=300266 RepID=A0A840RJ89_9NEIS|nr:type IV pili methyl-accepting chemotaxis transducer N-terminal domain-containing protein [Silvimonas terrae]MBB5192550.1 two-component system nitrate/nitrite sensor histidine kinase NarX [Silvimonas terrae]
MSDLKPETVAERYQLPLRRQLSMRVLALLLAALAVGLMAIGITLYLSWQLEGGGAAINAAGSLRMRTYRMALTLEHYAATKDPQLATKLRAEDADFRQTLALLRNGDVRRPLYLPDSPSVRQQFSGIEQDYDRLTRRWFVPIEAGGALTDWQVFRADTDQFVERINLLVLSIEQLNTRRTLWLRSSQMFLVGLAIVGAFTQVYLMFLLIFRPLGRLRHGIARMTRKDFTVRLPVESRDEFGEVQRSFNHMADRLEESYGSLAQRVEEKTAELNAQNGELSLLYDVVAFVNRPQTSQSLCQGVLERLLAWFGADAGSVRVIDPLNQSAWLMTSVGLPASLQEAEICRRHEGCYCAPARKGEVVLVQMRPHPLQPQSVCAEAGFLQVSAFPISAGDNHLGVITLHFADKREVSERETQLLTTLGQHLGIALDNLRLAARDKELAVSEERNLMAQGLHDSIAQGLSFLNLQVQMLDDSLKRNATTEAQDIVPMLRAGVTESYEDVRELLLNFRTRLQEGDLPGSMRTVIDKFRKQTGIAAALTITGEGRPLLADQQLQLLFILQEALSNVRKHSQATQVEVTLHNDTPLRLVIQDNGRGFDEAEMARRAERHVGLNIMRERAERLGAQLDFINEHGVSVVLTMHRATTTVLEGEGANA